MNKQPRHIEYHTKHSHTMLKALLRTTVRLNKTKRFNTFSSWTASSSKTKRFNTFSSWTASSSKAASPREILGVSPTSTLEEIDIAYRKLLLQVHPDQGGTTEAFLRVKQAREILTVQSNPELEQQSGGGLRKKSFEKRFQEAVSSKQLDQAWSLWSIVMSNQLEDPLSIGMCETYLQLLTTETGIKEKASVDKPAVQVEGVTNERWEGLLVACDAFQYLRENNQFGDSTLKVEEQAWNGLLWHLAQLPRNEAGGSAVMNDILLVCKRMDTLDILQDLELLRTQIFQGRT